MASAKLAGETAPSIAAHGLGVEQLLLLGHIGAHPYAVQTGQIKRVLRMAALSPLVDPRLGVVGMMNLHGRVLSVVDPRPHLKLPSPRFDPSQRLIVSADPHAYLLWVDRVDEVIVADPGDFREVATDVIDFNGLASVVLCWKGQVIPILSLDAFNPSPSVRVGPR